MVDNLSVNKKLDLDKE